MEVLLRSPAPRESAGARPARHGTPADGRGAGRTRRGRSRGETRPGSRPPGRGGSRPAPGLRGRRGSSSNRFRHGGEGEGGATEPGERYPIEFEVAGNDAGGREHPDPGG